jgi:signal transduction histidine kinase
MPNSVLLVIGVLLGAIAGWWLGRRRASPPPRDEGWSRLAGQLQRGELPRATAEAPEELNAVVHAITEQWTPRNAERQQALREALGRIAAFLREEIRGPLEAARSADVARLSDGVNRALGGLDDLDFFLREPLTPDEVHNVTPIVQQVAREFTKDWEVSVRLKAPSSPVRAHIHKGTFMDAVYLLLHNAGQFGGGETVDLSVNAVDGRALIKIRDRGPGFTAEALERAHDLFYTTTESGLGLGIPFARKIIESFGGDIDLENLPEGGAQVSLSLPLD